MLYVVIAYAGDVAIAKSGKFTLTIESLMQGALLKIESRCCRELWTNSTKTELVLFTNRRRIMAHDIPTIKGSKFYLKYQRNI